MNDNSNTIVLRKDFTIREIIGLMWNPRLEYIIKFVNNTDIPLTFTGEQGQRTDIPARPLSEMVDDLANRPNPGNNIHDSQ